MSPGPKKGVSETYLLRLPSLDEVFADADKGQNDAIEKLDKSLDEEKDLKKDLNEISQEMKKNQPLDWQKQKKAEETLKRYQELTKKIDEVSKIARYDDASDAEEQHSLERDAAEIYRASADAAANQFA